MKQIAPLFAFMLLELKTFFTTSYSWCILIYCICILYVVWLCKMSPHPAHGSLSVFLIRMSAKLWTYIHTYLCEWGLFLEYLCICIALVSAMPKTCYWHLSSLVVFFVGCVHSNSETRHIVVIAYILFTCHLRGTHTNARIVSDFLNVLMGISKKIQQRHPPIKCFSL